MKILCLPGSYGSAKNFQNQLGPFVKESERRGSAQFTWTQGTRTAVPPAGFEDYFGAGPLYRFIDYDGSKSFDMVESIRDFPKGPTAEATMRLLVGDQPSYALSSVSAAIRGILDQIDADPEIECLLGYSEGATCAATLILEERRLLEVEGRPRRIKRAIFFAGWPPLSMANEKITVLMADQKQDVIDLPSLHVVGSSDPYIAGAVALYNMCDRDTAELFDHGKGHTVPRDAKTIDELCDAIETLLTTDSVLSSHVEKGAGVYDLNAMAALTV